MSMMELPGSFAQVRNGRRLVASNCHRAISILAQQELKWGLEQDSIRAIVAAKDDCIDIENSGWEGDLRV